LMAFMSGRTRTSILRTTLAFDKHHKRTLKYALLFGNA
jgi:hypothetical protein